MQPAAKRKRAERERKRQAAKLSLVPPAAASSEPPSGIKQAAPSPPRVTLRETKPFTGPGADAFASIPIVPDANGEGSRPFVPPPAEEPKPPPSAADVALIVGAVTWYFELGTQAMFMRNPQLFELFPQQLVGHHFPAIKELVRGATERVAIKYSVRVPYGDELVVAGAVGLATFGFVGGPKNENKPPVTRDDPRVRHAKNANATAAEEKRAPRPVTSDDDTERDTEAQKKRAAAVANEDGTDEVSL